MTTNEHSSCLLDGDCIVSLSVSLNVSMTRLPCWRPIESSQLHPAQRSKSGIASAKFRSSARRRRRPDCRQPLFPAHVHKYPAMSQIRGQTAMS
jgi:hypothetical protein